MPEEEKMTIDERFKYLRLMKRQYVEASRVERGRFLDDMERVTGLHRKSLIRLMSSSLKRKPRRKQRGRTYGPEVDDALRVIAETHDYICAERLQPNLVEMATQLAHHGEISASPRLWDQLGRISVSTVRRTLMRLGQDEPRLPRKGPAQANRVAREIPMKRIPWNEQQPGHFEVDAVHHCGQSSAGHNVHTIQMVDVATGWSEQVAHCPCRMTAQLLTKVLCDHPLEVRLKYDELAEYAVEQGMARQINVDQAMDIIRLAEESGLVHLVDNSQEGIKHTCNCCKHACWNVGPIARRRLSRDDIMATCFLRTTDAEECIGSGDCVEACPVGALIMDEGLPLVDEEVCIGCGLCAIPCPSDAARLKRRTDVVPHRPLPHCMGAFFRRGGLADTVGPVDVVAKGRMPRGWDSVLERSYVSVRSGGGREPRPSSACARS